MKTRTILASVFVTLVGCGGTPDRTPMYENPDMPRHDLVQFSDAGSASPAPTGTIENVVPVTNTVTPTPQTQPISQGSGGSVGTEVVTQNTVGSTGGTQNHTETNSGTGGSTVIQQNTVETGGSQVVSTITVGTGGTHVVSMTPPGTGGNTVVTNTHDAGVDVQLVPDVITNVQIDANTQVPDAQVDAGLDVQADAAGSKPITCDGMWKPRISGFDGEIEFIYTVTDGVACLTVPGLDSPPNCISCNIDYSLDKEQCWFGDPAGTCDTVFQTCVGYNPVANQMRIIVANVYHDNWTFDCQ